MDFSVAGSDSWETTAAQEEFIHNYFQEQIPTTSSKTLKRKSVQNFDDLHCQTMQKRSKKKKKLKKTVELNEIEDKTQNSEDSFQESGEKEPISKMKTSRRKKMKQGLKKALDLSENRDLNQNSEDSIHEYDEKDLISKMKNSRKKKMKQGLKKALDPSENRDLDRNSEDSFHECNEKDLMSKMKNSRKKKAKQGIKKALDPSENKDLNQNSEDSIHEYDEKELISKRKKMKQGLKKALDPSEDQDLKQNYDDLCSASDEELILDIKNSEVFKEIQELMKQSPSLTGYSNESPGELSEDLNDSSFDEPSEEDLDDSSSEVVNTAKTINETRNVKEKLRVCNVNDRNMLSKNSGSLKEQMNDTSLVHNVNSKNQTVKSTIKNKAQEKMQAAKFRFLNEKLYTETGRTAFQYFQENVEEFHDYHKGYSLQVLKWPMNPVNKIISELQQLKKNTVIADMGCGDAKIARTLTKATVHSFDIVPLNKCVTACDISKVPLAKESVDVVVFCLSLMGINLKEYLIEAHRILKMGGTLKIAEVESRIDNVNVFVRGLKCLGFSLEKQDLKHKIFVFLDLKKEKKGLKKAKLPSLTLRPCLYKKR